MGIIASDTDQFGELIVFGDRPVFEVRLSGITFKYTCDTAYGTRDSKVFGLANDPQKIEICKQDTALENCPQLCKAEKCESCKDDKDTKIPFQNAKVLCHEIAENNGNNRWMEGGICDTEAAQEACPLTCGTCGADCADTTGSFDYKGETHYCHEANDAFCGHHAFSRHCPDSCNLPCFARGDGEESECPADDANYVYSIMGVEDQEFTNCETIPQLGDLIGDSTAPAKVCNIKRGDESSVDDAFWPIVNANGDDVGIGYYDNKDTPAEACPTACNAVDADAYKCTPDCDDELAEGTFVLAQRDDGVKAGKIRARFTDGECRLRVEFSDGNVADYEANDLKKDVKKCDCANGKYSVHQGAETACQESGYCAGTSDGECFAGEEICYDP